MVKVTVVTICRNAEKEIERTIQSVLRQIYKDYEYVIIDGKSTDKTLDVVKSYRKLFEDKGIDYKVISEPDEGIYDAMNKGAGYASGEWLIYMNSGDEFFDENVLKDIFEQNVEGVDVLYGDTTFLDKEYFKKRQELPLEKIDTWMPFCHQSAFVKRELVLEYQFNLQYKYASDYDMFVRLYRDKKVFKHINRMVSIYELNGVSTIQWKKVFDENFSIRRNNGIEEKNNYKILYLKTKFINELRVFVKNVFPIIFYSNIQGWYRDKYCGEINR